MKSKVKYIIITLGILGILGVGALAVFLWRGGETEQPDANIHLASRQIYVELGEDGLEQIGEENGMPVYTYHLEKAEVLCSGLNGNERIPMKQAYEEGLIHMDDMCDATYTKEQITHNGEPVITQYHFEMYQIVVLKDKYLILPEDMGYGEILELFSSEESIFSWR